MIQDAKENEEADRKFHELVDVRNKADGLVHEIEKSLSDLGDKVDAAEKEAIESEISELKELLKGDDKEAIETKTAALMEQAGKLAEQAQAAASADSAETPKDGEEKASTEDVVDAEFEEVKEDDKDSK